MKKILFLISLLIYLFGLNALTYAEPVKILAIRGDVQFKQVGQKGWQVARVGNTISEKGFIKTGKKSSALLRISNSTKIKLGANSIIQAINLKKKANNLKLQQGSLLAKIKKLAKKDKLNILTPTATAGVRGTAFYTAVKGTGKATKSLFCVKEGSVKVASAATKQPVTVTQGLGTQVGMTGPPTKPTPVKWIKQINWTMDTSPISESPIKPLDIGKSGLQIPSTGVPAPTGLPLVAAGDDDDEKKKEEEEDSARVDFILRLYGGLGYTFFGEISQSSAIVAQSQINWRFGIQGIFTLFDLRILRLGLGFDIGYIRLYEESKIKPSVLNTLAVAELELLRFIVAQAGAGQYWGISDYTGSDFGVMVAGGLDIPLGGNEWSFPIMLRADVIFADQTTTALSAIAGITLKY